MDPATKDASLRRIHQGLNFSWKWERILKELEKCQLLCRKHHIRKGQRNREHDWPTTGEAHYAARLTDAIVLEIRASPLPDAVLAERFGVHRVTVNRIRNRRLWRHI